MLATSPTNAVHSDQRRQAERQRRQGQAWLAAGLLGWGHVVDFLLRGHEAITRARPIDPLLDALAARETARMDRLIGQ